MQLEKRWSFSRRQRKKTAADLLDTAEREAEDIIRRAKVEAASIIQLAYDEAQQLSSSEQPAPRLPNPPH